MTYLVIPYNNPLKSRGERGVNLDYLKRDFPHLTGTNLFRQNGKVRGKTLARILKLC